MIKTILLDKGCELIKKKLSYHNVNVIECCDFSATEQYHKIIFDKTGINVINQNNEIVGKYKDIDEYIVQKLYFKAPINLYFHRQGEKGIVLFDQTVNIVSIFDKYNLTDFTYIKNVLNSFIHEGVYFVSPHNKRIKVNWSPGLTGIPYTPKKNDVMHELTYLFHDICHHTIRTDVIFSGKHDKLIYKVYIMSRMLSEAVSLVMADMIFVSYLLQKHDYETVEKRKIYPLYEKYSSVHNYNTNNMSNLLEHMIPILKANAYYAILGDDNYLKEIFGEGLELDNYETKYSKFYINDLQWTQHNYECMLKKSKAFQEWSKFMKEMNVKYQLGLVTVEDKINNCQLSEEMSNTKILDKLLGDTFQKLKHCLSLSEANNEKNKEKSYMRYVCNQLFCVFDLGCGCSSCNRNKVSAQENNHLIVCGKKLLTTYNTYTPNTFRKAFDSYLLSLDVLTIDDYLTYRELYSAIDPHYVNYDSTSIETKLSEVADSIMSKYG